MVKKKKSELSKLATQVHNKPINIFNHYIHEEDISS